MPNPSTERKVRSEDRAAEKKYQKRHGERHLQSSSVGRRKGGEEEEEKTYSSQEKDRKEIRKRKGETNSDAEMKRKEGGEYRSRESTMEATTAVSDAEIEWISPDEIVFEKSKTIAKKNSIQSDLFELKEFSMQREKYVSMIRMNQKVPSGKFCCLPYFLIPLLKIITDINGKAWMEMTTRCHGDLRKMNCFIKLLFVFFKNNNNLFNLNYILSGY